MNERLPKREEVKEELTWRLEDIYPDEGLWEEELKEARALAARVKEYEGKLGNSAQDLYGALKLYDDCSLKLDRVGGYSFMRHDQDAGNSHYQELELKVQSASVRISEELAFVEPEILAIPDDVIARCDAESGPAGKAGIAFHEVISSILRVDEFEIHAAENAQLLRHCAAGLLQRTVAEHMHRQSGAVPGPHIFFPRKGRASPVRKTHHVHRDDPPFDERLHQIVLLPARAKDLFQGS